MELTDSGLGFEPFHEEFGAGPAVHGFLHRPAAASTGALVLTHGAGSNCRSPLLVAVATAFATAGFIVLRCDLPFRQERPKGPPLGTATKDREGLRRTVEVVRKLVTEGSFSDKPAAGRVFLGGHSYGGRQASMLAAEKPGLVDGLVLLSYPLHPPRKPEQLRTAHFPKLRSPALFVHGSRDPFGSLEEMRAALVLIPAVTQLLPVEGAGHELSAGASPQIVATLLGWCP